MPIDTITSLAAFEELQDNWNAVYKADSHASVFLSWNWLHDNYRRHPDRFYTIYAWYTDGPSGNTRHRYSAFMPMCKRVSLNKRDRRFEPIIGMAGSYWADYTGVICNPTFDERALQDLSTHLAQQPLYEVRLDGLKMPKDRQKHLLNAFSSTGYKIRHRRRSVNSESVNLGVCPYVKLPSDPDEWLASLGSNTRQKIRRYHRKVIKSDDMNIRYATGDTLDNDLQTFKTLWAAQWESIKGKKVTAKANYYATLIRDGINTGHMYMRVLTYNDKVVGTTACYKDAVHKRELFLVSSRDTNFSKVPAGLLLHSQNIVDAIQNNYATYDFLRGDEDYKYTLGAIDAPIHNIRIRPRHVAIEARFLPAQLKNKALKALVRTQTDGKASSVEKIYSQLLESFPGDVDVLAAYRDWLMSVGEDRAAAGIDAELGS